MEEILVNDMECKIKRLSDGNVFKEKKLYIFGYTHVAEQMVVSFKKYNVEVCGIIDNDNRKWGQFLKGLPICAPNEILEPFNKEIVVAISAALHYDEILTQLIQLGYKENENIFEIISHNHIQKKCSLTRQEFDDAVKSVLKGRDIYMKIMSGREKDYLFIHPTTSIGDTYLGELFLAEYVIANNITNYCVVTIDVGGNSIIPNMFSIENNISLCKDDMDDLIRYSTFVDLKDRRIKILSNYLPHTSQRGNITNYKHINLSDNYYYGMFGLEGEVRLKHPDNIYCSKTSESIVDDKFDMMKLRRGKTVVIFPDAKSVSGLSKIFWRKLISRIKDAGYDVCVNTNKEEEYCNIAKVFNCGLLEIKEFVEKAGTMVSLRSGICDLLSMTKCKKIILYPDRIRGYGSLYDYFSINNMGLCDDALEIIFKENEEDNILVEKVEGLL